MYKKSSQTKKPDFLWKNQVFIQSEKQEYSYPSTLVEVVKDLGNQSLFTHA